MFAGLYTSARYIVIPFIRAEHAGILRQTLLGLFGPLLLISMGVFQMVLPSDDAKTMYVGAENQLLWTRLGKMIVYGIPAFVFVTMLIWYVFVQSRHLKLLWLR